MTTLYHLMVRKVIALNYLRSWLCLLSMTHLAQHQNVRLHIIMVAAEQTPSACTAGLHLIRDQQRVVLLQQCLRLAEVAIIWHHHSRLALCFS